MAEVGEVGSLGLILEGDHDVRDYARTHRQLTDWPEDAVGIPSSPAIGFNLRLLLHVLDWWSQQSDEPRTIPINIVREEA